MIFRLHKPQGEVASVIAEIIYHKGFFEQHDRERFLPDGGVNMVIDLTDRPKFVFDPVTLQPLLRCKNAWISGMRTAPITISSAKMSDMVVVGFQPAGAFAVWGIPLHELRDTVVDAEAALGPSVTDLRSRLLDCTDADGRFELVEAWAREAMKNRVLPDRQWGLAQFAVDWIRRAPTMASIDTVARRAGASNRHLIHTFKRFVGTTPKQFQRVHRFQQVVVSVDAAETVDWAQVALDCGYYDQAHLIRDFRHFSGFTPTEYLTARGKITNYVPVD